MSGIFTSAHFKDAVGIGAVVGIANYFNLTESLARPIDSMTSSIGQLSPIVSDILVYGLIVYGYMEFVKPSVDKMW